MRVRSLLITFIALAFGLIVTRLAVLEVRTLQREQLDTTQLGVERASRDAASLLVLSQEYLLRESPRAARQWHAVHDELRQALPPAAAVDTSLQADVATLRDVAAGLPELFSAIESTVREGDGSEARMRRDMLADHLVAETRRISDGAFALAEALAQLRRDRDVVERRVTQATMAAFALLTIALATLVLRRVLRPMTGLEAAAQAVERGDLAARSGWHAPDEFGRLSHAFDTMAASLQQREADLRAGNEHLRASETALDAARRDLQSILDAVPSMIGYWDKDLLNRFANHAYHHWFGREPGQLPGTHLRDLLGPALFERNAPFVEAALRGEVQTFERSMPLPDGPGHRHSLAHYLPDRVGDEVCGFYVLVHDISELTESRQQLAAALRENEALLSTIRAHTIFSVADRAGTIIDVNDNFCSITGYTREQLLGQNHRIISSGVHGPAFWAAMWRSISGGKAWRGQVCNLAKDGSRYWVDSIVAPFLGADGEIEKYVSIRTDITAGKLAEQRLRASEAFLDRAGQIAGVGGWALDLQSMTVTWSAQTLRIHEVEPDYRPALETALDFYAPAAREAVQQAVARCIEDGTAFDLEVALITAKGRAIWVRTVGEAELEAGKVVRLLGAFQDITLRRQADELLLQAHDRFAIAADSSNIGVWEFDPVANTLVWDARMYRLYQRERSGDIEPYTLWADSIHPADREAAEHCLAAALRGEREFDPEFRIRWPSGEWRYLKANARVAFDAAGKAVRMTGINLDITERKRAEIELLETSSLLRSVLESASEVAIIATDPHATITVFNAGAEKMLGYARQEVIGRSALVLQHSDTQPAALAAGAVEAAEDVAGPADATQLLQARQQIYLRKDGSTVPVSLVTTALRNDTGELLGYLGIAHDVTRQNSYEASLRDAMVKAEQASRAKSEFLANMSHEIRTPLNAVIGLSYLLRRTRLDAEQAEHLTRIDVASKSLLAVINDVLDLSKIEAGELLVEHAAFGLSELLKDLADVMAVHADAKGIDLRFAAPPELPDAVEGDEVRLRQVLTNLLSNAIKFTHHGAVTLDVSRRPAADDSVALRFEVRDTGIGISAEDGARIFSPFAQADSSTTRRFGGTGLGLSIVKQLVHLMGGTLGFDSVPDQGSCFWVELAFGIASEAALQPREAQHTDAGRGLAGVRVLVVDDSDINLAVARRILELEGAQVGLAANGQLAVAALQAEPDAFDLVLMDVQMPVMDGYEATQCIRERLGLVQLPIIALTAGALSSERQRATAVGMDDFISKPFHARSLVRSIRRHVRALPCLHGEERPLRPGPPQRPLQAPQAWPVIDGIDTDDVRDRLGDDLGLFRSTLKRLVTEFSALDAALPVTDRAALEMLTGSVHKLRGSAGLLGAKALHLQAEAAEAACRAGDAGRAEPLVRELANQVRALQVRAEALLGAPRTIASDADAMASTELKPRDLAALRAQLRDNSLAALVSFKALSPALRQRLGQTSFDALCECMDNLQFNEAAACIEAMPGQPNTA